MTLPPYLQRDRSGAWLLRIWVQPGAPSSAWAGLHGERTKVRIIAQASDGEAKRELIRFLSRALASSRADLELVAGAGSRGKTVRILGVDPDDLLSRLPG